MQQKQPFQNTQKILTLLLLLSTFIIYGYMVAQGNYFIYLDVGSDTMHSFYPIYRYAAACLREGTFSQWSFSIGTGGTTFNYTSVMMDPFAWPVIVAGAIFGDQVIAGSHASGEDPGLRMGMSAIFKMAWDYRAAGSGWRVCLWSEWLSHAVGPALLAGYGSILGDCVSDVVGRSP